MRTDMRNIVCLLTLADNTIVAATRGMSVKTGKGEDCILNHWDARRVYCRFPGWDYDRELFPSVIKAELHLSAEPPK